MAAPAPAALVSEGVTAKLRIREVSVAFRTRKGAELVAVDRLSLDVADREIVSIVGPSGCGKSTLLRLIAGLVRPSSGEIWLDGHQVMDPGADRGMVFQSYTLFPWLTVQGNVEFGPRLRGVPDVTRQEAARRFINMVGLAGFEHAYPKELSGGMMQRVAIARALANDPEVLLMDEPFGALDAQTRAFMGELLLDIWQKSPKTILFVTHDIEEALFLGDRVYVMTARPGRFRAEVSLPLPRPRTLEVTTSEEFVSAKRRVLAMIREETARTMGAGVGADDGRTV
ncbi:MAG TPA: ABC transporter ATP-binding protein [bacterium]|nr:ABC transporter ATP-binding protein [bacterium]